MICTPIGGKNFYINRLKTMSILVMIGLLCGLQGMSYADDSPAVELRASKEQPWTEANANTFVVTLELEGAAWAGISKIRPAVSVSGMADVTIRKEKYGSEIVWVCTSSCGSFVEFGYWRTVDLYRPVVRRKSDTVLEVPLTFGGNNFDFATSATLAFTVRAGAIAAYNGVALRAKLPVTIAVSASAPLALTEQNLGGSVVTLTLTGGKYAAQLLDGVVTVSGISGVGVSDVVRKSDTALEVPLTFDGNNFDTDATLAFTVAPAAIVNYNSVPVTVVIPVTPRKEVVSASVVSPLTEATLNGSIVTLLLTAAAYEQDISTIRNAVTVSGITGVTINTATVQRISDRKITVELDFDGTDFISDTALTFSVASGAITNYKGTALTTTQVPVIANTGENLLTIFWMDSGTDKIQRANLDLANLNISNREDLVTQGLERPRGIALDIEGGKMYWTDSSTDKIQRANLDGSNVENLVTQGLESPRGIALDIEGDKMYWTDFRTKKIQRANLDGSNVEDLVTRLGEPTGIAISISSSTDPVTAKEDVNGDGVVDVQDLAYVGLQYGKTGTNAADVNGDKVVNVDDLILVAAAIDNAAAAKALAGRTQEQSHFTASQLQDFTASQLQGWLTKARASGNTSHRYQKGIAVLEQLLAVLTPKEIALLANYPNPFNPTTTIRYVLPHATDVELTVHNVAGQSVRTLVAESQRAGHYAVAWDATDAQGQPVAAGLYFYHLQAGAFHAVEKMLLLK